MSFLPVLGLCAVPAISAMAYDDSDFVLSHMNMYYEAQDIHQTMNFDEDDGLTMSIAGRNPEKGVLSLYVKADINDMYAVAEELNSIEPSIGVQFDIDF